MAYRETDCELCKACYVKLKHPPKKAVKKMELTSYKGLCEECFRMDRLVEYIWEPDEEEDN